MKVLALQGSPRKGGNTDLILDKILEGVECQGHTTEKISLYPLKILPCYDCRQCKKTPYTCPLKYDMHLLVESMIKSDIIIFGTPIYWYGPTAMMKLAVDRMRPFILNHQLAGKTGILVVPSEEGPSICDPLVKMFQMSFSYVGMAYGGAFLASAYEKGEIGKNLAEIQRAYEFGKGFKRTD